MFHKNNLLIFSLALFFSCVNWSMDADASLVTFSFSTSAGDAGSALDGTVDGTAFTKSNITLKATTSSSQSSQKFTANGGGGGIHGTGPGSAFIDAANSESLKFTFTFTNPPISSLHLTQIMFSGQEGNEAAGDSVFVNVAGTDYKLFDGASDYDEGTNTWTLSTPLSVASGQMITFTAEDSYQVKSITFSAVPEPTSFAMFGMALAGMTRRRRKP